MGRRAGSSRPFANCWLTARRAAVSDEQRAGQKRHLAAATPALRDAIAEESAALAACAEEFGRASEQVMRRGQELFGGDDDDE